MKLARTFFISASFLIAGSIAEPVTAQDTASMSVTVHVSDSAGYVVDRSSLDRARFAIVSENGDAALLLTDTAIVAQMTDRGLQHINSADAKDTTKSVVGKMVTRMAVAALGSLFDHGIAYNVRDLSDANYADGRLQLLGSKGQELFRDVKINDTPLMESFRADDAKAFAARVRAARR